MATNFRVKIDKIELSPLFVALAFRNGLQYRHSDFLKSSSAMIWVRCVNFVNFCPVTPEFRKVIAATRRRATSQLTTLSI